MKICLDAGHGGAKPGAEFRGLLEKNVDLGVVLQAGELLEDRGHAVVYTREDDSDVGLMERCDIANLNQCDVFVSVHCNADPDEDEPGMPEAKGEEIWIYDNSKKGLKLAKCLADEVDAIFPDEPFRGIKSTEGLVVLHYTNMPAVLIEIGFIDKSSTNESFRDKDTIERISELIAKGIQDYLES